MPEAGSGLVGRENTSFLGERLIRKVNPQIGRQAEGIETGDIELSMQGPFCWLTLVTNQRSAHRSGGRPTNILIKGIQRFFQIN